MIEAYAVFEVEPAAIFQQVECVNADASAVCHGDRDLFLFRVDVYEVEGEELFSVIELEFAQLVLFLYGLYLLCYFASLNQI